ncbi:MAG: transcription antitermination factor NusB [Ilumatobacteraceae bacterium]
MTADDSGHDDKRTRAREAALTALYEAETKGIDPRLVLESQILPPAALTTLLVEGVSGSVGEIDELIAKYATGWSLDRMPTLDLLVLRVATYELVRRPEVPIAVVIDEAVELAKRFSTDDSGRFVNGVLASIARETRPAR